MAASSDFRRVSSRPAALALRFGLAALAWGLLASMLVTALHDASQAWDVNYYHLPFAGRLVGLLPKTSYVFSAANEARYQGFGLFAELCQGLLWRATGRPESANLVAFVSVPLLAWFARAKLGVPAYLSVLSLLAIPLVHTHATSGYVDLPGNAAASVLVLVTLEAYASDRPIAGRSVGLALLAGAVAANIKPMLQPVVGLSLVFFGIRIARHARGEKTRRLLALLVLALPLVFATPLKNLWIHGNPFFPVRLSVLGHFLPGAEDPYASSPVWLEHMPRPVRFVCSLFELGLRPLSDPRRWSVDQWMPPDAAGYRMGGFFHAYVLAQGAVLVWRVVFERTRRVRVAAVGFALLTVLISFLPQSHELRYYMVWMIVLVLANLWLACERTSAVTPARLGGVAAVALALVLLVTKGVYAYPSGSRFADLVRRKVDERQIRSIAKDERVCVAKEPFDLLWAPVFHPEQTYVLKEAEVSAECDGYRQLE